MHSPRSNIYPFERQDLILLVAILATTFVVYGEIRTFEYVSWDDPVYVAQNPIMHQIASSGASSNSVHWALTTFEASNWHPLTWFSHMLDVLLY